MTPERDTQNIAVLLACHNRREKTLECLRSLARQRLPGDIRQSVTLLDDGSSDGTAEAVLAEFPDTTILCGDGDLFWCGGMRLAWSSVASSNPDYFLPLNDNTLLDGIALQTLLKICDHAEAKTVAVAAIRGRLRTRAHIAVFAEEMIKSLSRGHWILSILMRKPY